MTAGELIALIVVGLPIAIWMYFWTKHDLENKRGITAYDPKTGKKISNFGDWLDGKE